MVTLESAIRTIIIMNTVTTTRVTVLVTLGPGIMEVIMTIRTNFSPGIFLLTTTTTLEEEVTTTINNNITITVMLEFRHFSLVD